MNATATIIYDPTPADWRIWPLYHSRYETRIGYAFQKVSDSEPQRFERIVYGATQREMQDLCRKMTDDLFKEDR